MTGRGQRHRWGRGALALLLLVHAGCSAASRPSWLQEPGWNKPWSYRSGVAAAVCAAIGAGAGVGVQQARTSCSRVTVNGQSFENCSSIGDSDSNTFWLWGALIGAASGAVLCGILGHVFLDPAEVVEPPPPPVVAEAAPAPPPPVAKRIVLRGVGFDFNSATLRPDALPVLDQAALLLKENPDIAVRVEGHTDNVGSAEYNLKLSVRRAEAVYRYLVNQGIDPERLRVEGFGLTRPVASNDTESGRAQNRRVELQVVP
ncbi:MAG: OmpA family protein [Deltaproteobacteria bacterium]|nr:OmpA family protein [Deltaproteobacteria bacterium]